MLLRTPYRVIAFHKLTGEVQWQLPTDSAASVPTDFGLAEKAITGGQAGSWLHNDRAALLTVTDTHVYFVDSFREPPLVLPQGVNLQPFSSFMLMNAHGRRLIAVSLDGRLSWVQGRAEPDYQYQVVRDSSAKNAAELIDDSRRRELDQAEGAEPSDAIDSLPADPFKGHRFTGPPAVVDDRLYCLLYTSPSPRDS